jgi:SSS family transporter
MLIIATCIYFVLTISIGYYASKKVVSTGDYINAGRKLHPALNAAALFALWFGSETIFGASAEFAQNGFRGVIEDPFGGFLCLLIVGMVFSRRMYRLNMYTIGDLFRRQFGQSIEVLASIMMIVNFLAYSAAQMVALGLLFQTLSGLSLPYCIFLGFLIVLGYTYLGGMWAVSLTDFIQSILIILGLIVIAYYITEKVGSVTNILATVPSGHKKFLPESGLTSWINWIAAWMVLGLGSVVSQDIFQRINSARSEDAAFFSSITGAFMYIIFAMIPLYLIIACKMLDPNLLAGDLQLSLPKLVLNHMPLGVQIIFFGSLISAIMSTCSGALLAPASLLSENVLKPLVNKELSDTTLLKYTRFSLVLIGFLSMLLAFENQNIFDLVGIASVFGLISIFVPYVAALFFNQTSRSGALGSILMGIFVWVFFSFCYKTEINALVPGLAASIIGWFIGLGFDKFTANSQVVT